MRIRLQIHIADDMVILRGSEDKLEMNLYRLSKVLSEFNFDCLLARKIKWLLDIKTLIYKIVLDGDILEQLSGSNYRGCHHSFNND